MRLGVGTHLELTPGFEALNWRHTQVWLEEAPKTRAVRPPAAVVTAATAAADTGSLALSPAPGAAPSTPITSAAAAAASSVAAFGATPFAAGAAPSAPITSAAAAAAAAASVAAAGGGQEPNSCEARLWPHLQVRMPMGTGEEPSQPSRAVRVRCRGRQGRSFITYQPGREIQVD